jgi:uncharacterized protein YbbK (DUF523 family)
MEKIRIGISACLLGENVRYDGGHRHDPYLTDSLGRYFDWVPVCPEVEYGLGVPREPMRLEGDPEAPRLLTIRTRIDHTEGMLAWAAGKLDVLAGEDLCGFIFKEKSPSSGMAAVKVYNEAGVAGGKGVGIFAGAFRLRRMAASMTRSCGRTSSKGSLFTGAGGIFNGDHAEIILLTHKTVIPILPPTEASHGCARQSLEKPIRSTPFRSIEHFFRRCYERKL